MCGGYVVCHSDFFLSFFHYKLEQSFKYDADDDEDDDGDDDDVSFVTIDLAFYFNCILRCSIFERWRPRREERKAHKSQYFFFLAIHSQKHGS